MENPDVWALFDHPPAPTYYKGRLCLVGDAAHASTPHQGAGAGQAIEDAFILSSLLGQVGSPDNIDQVFKAYDAVRRPRSQKVVTTSREVSKIYEFENEKLGFDFVKAEECLRGWYDWIWNEDLQEQLRKAERLMDIHSKF
jgi:salicylate hydroxylase